MKSPYKHEGRQALQWILIDYVNVVVHIMMPEQRKFYQLEEMWSDAPWLNTTINQYYCYNITNN